MAGYSKLEKIVQSNADVIPDMADKVWEFAELGFQELKSSAYESDFLEKNGFASAIAASVVWIHRGLPAGARVQPYWA